VGVAQASDFVRLVEEIRLVIYRGGEKPFHQWLKCLVGKRAGKVCDLIEVKLKQNKHYWVWKEPSQID